MKDEKVILRCDECGTILKVGIPDQDSRGYIWCRGCGLVYEPGHEMGLGFSGLISYMEHKGLNDYIDQAKVTNSINGLARARLFVSKL